MEDPELNSTSEEGKDQLPAEPKPKEGAELKPAEGAEAKEGKETPEPPKVEGRRYSEEEWNKRQSALDRQVEELRKQHKGELKQIRVQLTQQARQDFLRKVEEEGGDVGKAGSLFDKEQELTLKEQELTEGLALMEKVKKDQDASDFLTKFSLSKDAKDQLLKAGSPAEMRAIALELALEQEKTAKTLPVKTASGVGTGKAADTSKMSPTERAARYFEENP